MNKKKLRLAIIGGRMISQGSHLLPILSSLYVRITVIIDCMLHSIAMPNKITMLTNDNKGNPEANYHCIFEYDSDLCGEATFSKSAVLLARQRMVNLQHSYSNSI